MGNDAPTPPPTGTPPTSPGPLAAPMSLTDRTAAGAGFMAATVVASRVIGFACNLVLTHFLAPEHFGILTMAMTVAALAGLVQSFGLREVLIRKQSSYRHLANAGFWFSVLTGMSCAGLILAAAPLAVAHYHEPRLWGVLGVLAASVPLASISLVPEARLSIDLRFRWMSALNASVAIGSVLLSVVFAILGFKEYALVLPRLIMTIVRTALAFHVSGFRPRMSFQLRRWKYFIGDSTWALLSALAMTIVIQVDAILLGRAVSSESLGLYTWSQQLSLQVMIMLAMSLGQVLMPALAKLSHEPRRQAEAAIRACRMLGMLVVPTFLLQAAAIDPLLRLLFTAEWQSTIPILQVLSVGMAGRFFGQPTQSLFQSQGRFRGWTITTFVMAATLIGSIMLALWLTIPAGQPLPIKDAEAGRAAALAVAIALSIWGVVLEPACFYLAVRHAGSPLGSVIGIVLRPLLVSVAAVGAGYFAMGLVPEHWFGGRALHVARLFVLGAVATPLIMLGMYLFMRPTVDELLDRLGPMLGSLGIRRRGRGDHPRGST